MPVPTPVSTSWSQRARRREGGRQWQLRGPRHSAEERHRWNEMRLRNGTVATALIFFTSFLSLSWYTAWQNGKGKLDICVISVIPPPRIKKCQKDRRSLDEAWLTSWQAESWNMTSKQHVLRHSRWSHPSRGTRFNVVMRNNPCYRYNKWMEFFCFKLYCAPSPVPVNHTQSAVSSHPH